MNYSCDLCNRKFKWGEVYVAYLNDNGTRMNFCLKCSEKPPDRKKRKGVHWGVLKNGISDLEYKT